MTYEGIKAHHEEFMGKSAEQIAEMLKENGLIKVIDDTREQYRTDGTEKARLIFRRDDDD